MPLVPLPRRPLDAGDRLRRWYEHELGWPTVPGTPLHLAVGVRFDVLDVPVEAGLAGLRHLVAGSPVAVRGDRMRLLVAPGSAEELPGVLEWLEWGSLPLDLRGIGGGGGSGVMEAPVPPGGGAGGWAGWVDWVGEGCPEERVEGAAEGSLGEGSLGGASLGEGSLAQGSLTEGLLAEDLPAEGRLEGAAQGSLSEGSLQGAAVWLRPPEPGCEVEASLPTLSAMGGVGGAPDLVRLVDTVATHCHRIRLRRACGQALAFS
ncbi:SCO3374 family protein [Streptomyces spinoverrucosus]|uniref:SCO3374 family protein n=1 Tax=Streptomyces spinoverrucosus TaxID=284043 RepID=UPI001E3A24AB|nr:SCO3374 family protein [Streptomyces spinoverrucosus]